MSYRVPLRPVVLLMPMLCVGQTGQQPRVYVEQSRSWAVGGWNPLTGLLAAGGGARPQTAEIIHTFTKRCPAVTPTLERGKAGYIVLLEHEGGKSIFRRDKNEPKRSQFSGGLAW
jgi:hypothetical protein